MDRFSVAGMASEEMDDCLVTPSQFKRGKYLITFDPSTAPAISTLMLLSEQSSSITKAPEGEITNESFLIPGRQQVAAGYVMYFLRKLS